MKINQKFDFVDGTFDTDTGKLECVKYSKYNRVDLCFKEGMNIPFAQIKLHSRDLSIDAQEVLEDANNLGEEIVKRWNDYKELKHFYDSSIGLFCTDKDPKELLSNFNNREDKSKDWAEWISDITFQLKEI